MANKTNETVEIDIVRLLKALWRRAWAILLAIILFGAVAFCCTEFLMTPMYKASVLMYVNSSNVSLGDTKLSISQSELNAAKSLIDTYTVILKTRSTLNEVIEETGLNIAYEDLVECIDAASVNSTEVFQIDVVHKNPREATLIANTIAQVLPDKIASIVEGTSARIVDMAVLPEKQDTPSLAKNLLIGMALGMVFSCSIIIIREMTDDKIQNSDYLLQTYDLPILAVIPDLLASSRTGSNYYYQSAGKEKK